MSSDTRSCIRTGYKAGLPPLRGVSTTPASCHNRQGRATSRRVWQIVVEEAWFIASLVVALMILRLIDLWLRSRWPSASKAIEFAIGQA